MRFKVPGCGKPGRGISYESECVRPYWNMLCWELDVHLLPEPTVTRTLRALR